LGINKAKLLTELINTMNTVMRQKDVNNQTLDLLMTRK